MNESIPTLSRVNSTLTSYHISKIQFWSEFYVQTTVCLIGAALNILNVIVFSHKQFEATPYIYMTVLAFVDAGTSLVHLPYGLAKCSNQLELCKTEIFKHVRLGALYYVTYAGFGLGNVLEAISAWINVLICAERYIVMKRPDIGKLYFSRLQGKKQVLGIICLAISFNSPLFFILKVSESERPDVNNITKRYHMIELTWFGKSGYYYCFTWIRFIFVQCIPLIVLCVCSFLLLRLLWSSIHNQKAHQICQQIRIHEVPNSEPIESDLTFLQETQNGKSRLSSTSKNETNSSRTGSILKTNKKPKMSLVNKRLERSQQATNKLSVLLVCVIFLFIVGQIPQAFAYVHILQAIVPQSCQTCRVAAQSYRHFSQLLCLLTSAANFFLYITLNRHFRDCLKTMCSPNCRKQ